MITPAKILIITALIYALGVIAVINPEKDRLPLRDRINNHKKILIIFTLMVVSYDTYLFWGYGDLKSEYKNIFKKEINNDSISVIAYPPISVILKYPNNQTYSFIPENIICKEFVKLVTTQGYSIRKNANSDTIYLIKDNDTIIGDTLKCLIRRPP